jgi:hypothetical protein
MTDLDTDLLQWAAKAAGVPEKELSNRYDCWEDRPILIGTAWNPLENDGDALRLAVKLEMLVDTVNRVVSGYLSEHCVDISFDEQNKDPYAATRRAIVRAAAEIGKAMP